MKKGQKKCQKIVSCFKASRGVKILSSPTPSNAQNPEPNRDLTNMTKFSVIRIHRSNTFIISFFANSQLTNPRNRIIFFQNNPCFEKSRKWVDCNNHNSSFSLNESLNQAFEIASSIESTKNNYEAPPTPKSVSNGKCFKYIQGHSHSVVLKIFIPRIIIVLKPEDYRSCFKKF